MAEEILLSHGEGGKRTRDLVRTLIVTRFGNPVLSPLLDSGLLGPIEGEIAFTADSYVVTPPVFPGGDIGRLAVCGTLNDLAVCGAKPVAISCSLILEEGFPVKDLERILDSMQEAAREGEVLVACGDTKVVERGKGDGIFITTSGIGALLPGWRPSPKAVSPGDRVILTGTMGDHQVSVLIARNLLEISAEVLSDAAPLSSMLLGILEQFGGHIRFLRDPTRGGVGVSLIEMAGDSERRIILDESLLPVTPAVRGVCEILGFDPLYLANEGKALLIVSPSASDAVVAALREHPYGGSAVIVGEVAEGSPGVLLRTTVGGLRAVDYPVGDQLPRIC
ncbi:MAG: hydrogenase expression/formation protein HypE [Deltaproteobacteria bacterium]|nr:hydrogenase expression/formation protein HypE [Deltaproteobacteria bacterium]NNG45838.1 hydrogenase expression/formation protein HypE [Deltaproteobacteria bacterium]